MICLGIDAAGADVLDQARQVALHAGLVHAHRQALVQRIADRDRVEGRAVHADDRHIAALAHRVDGPVQHGGGAGLHLHQRRSGSGRAAGRFAPTQSMQTSAPSQSVIFLM
jgi:hypothetical protein